MLKVMNIISDTNIGGAGRVLLNYVKYCNRYEFDICAVLPKGSELTPRLKTFDIKVIEANIEGDRSFDKKAIPVLSALIKQENPDLVHTHGSLSARIAAKRCGKKIIYTRHCAFPVKNYMKKGPLHWANRWLNLHYADRVIAVGNAAKDSLVESGIPEKYIDVMMNGSEQLPKATPEQRSLYRCDLGIAEDEFVIGMLARIEVYKGYDDVFDALKLLLAEGLKVKFVIAGSGQYEAELKKRAFDEGLQDVVIFTGFIENVAEILSVMDVQINASFESETSSLSVIEGFSIGLPAVVSDCGGNVLLVDDSVNGYIFPMRDSAKLASCIKILAEDRELLLQMGDSALKIYNERFTGQSFAAHVEEVYIKVMGGKING